MVKNIGLLGLIIKDNNMYRSYKEFNGYSTAFRQWRADSHCRFIHGYALRFKVWFDGELDYRNWVVDFGCFKRNGIKDWMKNMFDHTTIISVDDPERNRFEEMDKDGLIQLRIMEDVGCEKFAEYVFKYLNKKIKEETNGRVKVHKVQCWEHGENMAEYYE
jgi:6-pyruvoyltetrahydropterin/6-carboxytetrahydropterin synthase